MAKKKTHTVTLNDLTFTNVLVEPVESAIDTAAFTDEFVRCMNQAMYDAFHIPPPAFMGRPAFIGVDWAATTNAVEPEKKKCLRCGCELHSNEMIICAICYATPKSEFKSWPYAVDES